MAVINVALSVLFITAGVVNSVSGFLGDGWLFTVGPLVLGVVTLRSASLLWKVRDRVAVGQDRLAALDEPTRRARKRRATRLVWLELAVMGAISIAGAIVGGWLGFFVALLALLIALELLGLVTRLLRSRAA
jgi:uncharacterized membrane protein YfcA